MFTVDNKFEIGQEVYLVTGRKEYIKNKCTCDVCLGLGIITYKGYEINCPKCNGKKEILLDSKMATVYFVEETPCKIISYRYSVSTSGNILRYKIKHRYDNRNVAEEDIFATREEAVKACDDLNMFNIYNEYGKQLLEQAENNK